jgi:hypothetical protein
LTSRDAVIGFRSRAPAAEFFNGLLTRLPTAATTKEAVFVGSLLVPPER